MARITLTCDTCGASFASQTLLATHLVLIRERRKHFGPSGDLAAPRKTYRPVDIATEPTIPYTRAEYHDEDA